MQICSWTLTVNIGGREQIKVSEEVPHHPQITRATIEAALVIL